jgi:hypothetical protein
MKTADGQPWSAQQSTSRAAAVAIKPVVTPLNKATKANNSDAENMSNTQQKPIIKMRPTQILISKNEGNTWSSWLRDIATICCPLYMVYMLATHPLIKDIGQPHNRKLTKLELHEKFVHEYNQKLEFQQSVHKYNFLMAVNMDQCYEFPSSEMTKYMPNRSAIFKDRYKKWLPRKGGEVRGENKKYEKQHNKKKEVRGIMVNARKKMIPH